ncbi:MAG TPA: peptidoglycan editing factor PgeF [Clostridiales bacterium]|nr:peptidoglycan editing factor PgeF [Clostridiales bacterium]
MRRNFKMLHTKNGISYFSIPLFDETKLVKSCFTTRIGGVSEYPYHSLNLGLKTMDKKENVLQNFRLLSKELAIPLECMVRCDQVHGDRSWIVTQEDAGKGIISDDDVPQADALITNVRGIGLITNYADCVPIFLLDPVHKVIALAHAGWRGTVLQIGRKTLQAMTQHFHTDPKHCLAAIGPSIGPCCYEVDESVIEQFEKSFRSIHLFVNRTENGKFMLDLWKANQVVLEESGILKENISISQLCTACHPEIFFSHRQQKGVTGRMAAMMVLV